MRVVAWIVIVGFLGWPSTVIFMFLFMALSGNSNPNDGTFTLGLIAGLGSTGVCAWWFLWGRPARRERAASAAAFAEAQREAAWKKELQKKDAQESIKRFELERVNQLSNVAQNSSDSAREYSRLPQLLGHIHESFKSAEGHFDEKAYSPFWSSIERAYGGLAEYYANLLKLKGLAARHGELCSAFRRTYGTNGDLEQFPLSQDSVEAASSAADAAARKLGELVYRAQKITSFAIIWEQRRTTAAVVAGFGSLEQAVSTMSGRLNGAIASLAMSVEDLSKVNLATNGAVVDAISSVNDSAALMGHSVFGAASGAIEEVRSASRILEAGRGW